MTEVDTISPEPTNWSKSAIYQIAEQVADALDVQPSSNLNDVIESLGGRVLFQDYWQSAEENPGAIHIFDLHDFVIYVPTHTTEERDRFTIAHELGHYFLHYVPKHTVKALPVQMVASRYGSDRVEWEANWFAAAFLMPSRPFRSIFEKHNVDLIAVAKHFRVSEQAALVRAKELRIDHGPAGNQRRRS
jgi:Zn-dependent peptidase ImmA (M78 family)